jgi:hypothetical protein
MMLSSSAFAVSMIIGMDEVSRTRLQTASPEISGSIMSSRMSDTGNFSNAASASLPVAAHITLNALFSRYAFRSSNIRRSSSTTKINPSPAICYPAR